MPHYLVAALGLVLAVLAAPAALASGKAASPAGHSDAAAKGDHATVTAGDLLISDFWVRAPLPNQPVAGGYLTVENSGDAGDRILSVASSVSGRAEIHEMSMQGDVMQMRPMPDGLSIPAGETVSLEPGGYHLMFMDLDGALEAGDTIDVTLTFEKAGAVDLALPVRASQDGAAASDEHQH